MMKCSRRVASIGLARTVEILPIKEDHRISLRPLSERVFQGSLSADLQWRPSIFRP